MATAPQSKRTPSLMHFLSLAVFLLLIPAAYASAPTCGAVYSGTGICTYFYSDGTRDVACPNLHNEGCCLRGPNCLWDAETSTCAYGSGSHITYCGAFNDNRVACLEMGCDWKPPAGSCGGSATGNGYGEPCGTGCATCLVCDTTGTPPVNRCTQRPGVCTLNPAVYEMPAPVFSNNSSALSPMGAINNLTMGSQGGRGGAVVGTSSGFYAKGWFSDWKIMGIIGVAMVCSIIALAAMIGQAFNLPEIKAFANNELKQAVISAMLIVSLIALITFFDEIAFQAIQGADLPIACHSDVEPCYITSAKYYLTTLYDTGAEFAKNNLEESISNMKRSSLGYNINMNKIYFAFAGFSIRFNAGDSLIAERHGAMFSQVSKILTSIYAQKYFIDVITFGIAPLFILLGIVLRTFFFTRKLGGLMLAIAISLFMVYPLSYAFAWYTLNVTVYGERTLAVADPACPGECTVTYPVAFFTDPTTGQQMQFPTIQSLLRTGINSSNWNTGGPNLDTVPGPDFPGLVACRNLSSVSIPDSIAHNSCSDCPDYCRDVPFPTNMPGCNITKCSTCNPGCKIVRQRLNCETDPACAGKCPLKCRTQIPTENKCFDNESGGVIPANFSVDCSGCEKFPAWCRFLFQNASGALFPMYSNATTSPMCVGINDTSICPSQCSYITKMGADTTCDNICSIKTPSGNRIVCPEQCRVENLFNTSWVSTYDIDPPNYTRECTSTPDIIAACNTCSGFPECMVKVTMPPSDGCAKYPINNKVSKLCLDCPEYCRRDTWAGFFPNASNVERDAVTSVPLVCDPAHASGINCSSSGNPPACNSSCRTTANPIICRSFDQNHGADVALCKGCPDNARYKVRYTKNGPDYVCNNGIPTYLTPATGEYTAILSNSTSVGAPAKLAAADGQPANDGGAARLSEAESGRGAFAAERGSGAAKLAEAEGRGGTISLTGTPSVTVTSSRIAPNASVYAGTPLTGYCNAFYSPGAGYSEAGSNAVLAHRQGTSYLDSPGNGQHVGTIYFAGEHLAYQVRWYRNGVLNYSETTCIGSQVCLSGEEISVSLPSAPLQGDIWVLSCQASYYSLESAWRNSSNVTILVAPVMQTSSIQPTLAYRTSTLQGFCNATFAANPSASLTYEYKWYKNNIWFSEGANPSPFQQGIQANIASMASANLNKLQNWTFSCRANFGGNYSEWLNSTSVKILANPPEPPCTVTESDINLSSGFYCDDASCPLSPCQANPIYVNLPNQDNDAACDDANVTDCPYGCRVRDLLTGQLNPGCEGLCSTLPLQCFAVRPTVPICNEYIGNGNKSCHNPSCLGFKTESTCQAASSSGCSWQNGYCDAWDPASGCNGKLQTDCINSPTCSWMYTQDYIPMGSRPQGYGDPTTCRQCPEQCRLNSTSGVYEGDCGVESNTNNNYVNCLEANCPAACRIPEPMAPANLSCSSYPEETGLACKGCPALCRRSSDLLSSVSCPPSCLPDPDPAKGCTDLCLQQDPPEKACEGCFECDFDCTYYPAIRSDCSDICSDEALAGPVNIAPDDFIKKLPGASTSTNGKWARDIGVLYIPGVLLPLFCIVMVVAFVRILSPVLGGDIEIPGLGKII